MLKVEFFLFVDDQVITIITIRFEQYLGYEKIFDFLFTSLKL